jgi:DNA helicase-2/ATP-dependent DNA helicase PcrA
MEFDVVILPAFEDELIPSQRENGDVSEARRLAYVAMTRARHELLFSYARYRRCMYGAGRLERATPSRFLKE